MKRSSFLHGTMTLKRGRSHVLLRSLELTEAVTGLLRSQNGVLTFGNLLQLFEP